MHCYSNTYRGNRGVSQKKYIDTAWKYINGLEVNKKQLLHIGIINQMPLPEKLYRKHFMKEGSWSK